MPVITQIRRSIDDNEYRKAAAVRVTPVAARNLPAMFVFKASLRVSPPLVVKVRHLLRRS